MLFSLSTSLILIGAAIITSIISGITGMAGGTIMLAVIMSLVETTYIVPLHATVQVMSNGTRSLVFFKHINWKIVLYFLAGVLPGVCIGIFAFQALPKDIIKWAMGIFILLAIYAPKPKKELSLGLPIFLPVGLIAGLIGIFFGAIGPFIGPFFLRNDVLKEELVATKAVCQMITHFLKIPLFGLIGINVFIYWQIIIGLGIAVIAGTLIGKKILTQIPKKNFKITIKIILTLLALRIIIMQSYALLF